MLLQIPCDQLFLLFPRCVGHFRCYSLHLDNRLKDTKRTICVRFLERLFRQQIQCKPLTAVVSTVKLRVAQFWRSLVTIGQPLLHVRQFKCHNRFVCALEIVDLAAADVCFFFVFKPNLFHLHIEHSHRSV